MPLHGSIAATAFLTINYVTHQRPLPCADFHPLARRKKTVGQQTHRQSRDQHRHSSPTHVHVAAVREGDNDEGVRSAMSGSSVTPAGARRTLTGFISSALGSHSSGGTDTRVSGRERGMGREGGGRGGGGKRRLTKGQRPTGKSSSRKRVRLGELVVGDGEVFTIFISTGTLQNRFFLLLCSVFTSDMLCCTASAYSPRRNVLIYPADT